MTGEKPMRVLHLLDTDGFAGTERHVLALLSALQPLGVDVVLACRQNSPLEAAARRTGLSTLALYDGADPISRRKRLQSELRERRINIVHAHNGRTMLLAASVCKRPNSAAKTGAQAVGTQHFLAPQFTTYQGLKKLVAAQAHHWVNKRLTHFIAVSEAARNTMQTREHLSPEKITIVPNGIAALVPPDDVTRARLRREFKAPIDGLLVVTVARLAKEKGISTLLEALPAVLAAHPQTRIAIVGEGPLRAELEAQAQQAGIAACVTFTGFRDDATQIIGAGDLFVLPAPAEPFGLVLLEAMALAKPVIATCAGGPLEIVATEPIISIKPEIEPTGRLVAPADAQALADALKELLAAPGLRARMGQAGLVRYQTQFTADSMAARTLAVYQRVVMDRVGTTFETSLRAPA